MKFRVVPYKPGSNSAKLLATALKESLGYHVFRGPAKPKRININWGCEGGINPAEAIKKAQNKLRTFEALKDTDVLIPWFTTNKTEAAESGKDIVVRKLLNSHSGKGIEEFNNQDAPLYVEYVKKIAEFRVHVVNGEVIDVQAKRKRKLTAPDQPKANPRIRNLDNGWVFCREDVEAPAAVLEQAKLAVTSLGLAWGAVDIVWNKKNQAAVVLEVNTAPGLCETSAKIYANAFINAYGQP
jgi:hypothetical protein